MWYISSISTGCLTSRAYTSTTSTLLQGIHLFHNCLCSHFMEFINLSAFHPLLTYFFPVSQGRTGGCRERGVRGISATCFIDCPNRRPIPWGGGGGRGCGVVWQTCITHVSHNCRMKVNGLALQRCVHSPHLSPSPCSLANFRSLVRQQIPPPLAAACNIM